MIQTVIRNARVFCRNQVVISDVLIERGIIAKIGSVRAGGQEIDARGRLLLPGAIDAHVHFRDLDEAYKEDWYSGSCAAAAGGVTTVIDQPNSKPPVCDERAYFRKQRAARKSVVDYGINAGIEKLDQLDDLCDSGLRLLVRDSFKKNRARNCIMRFKLSSASMPCYAFTLKDVSVKSQANWPGSRQS